MLGISLVGVLSPTNVVLFHQPLITFHTENFKLTAFSTNAIVTLFPISHPLLIGQNKRIFLWSY